MCTFDVNPVQCEVTVFKQQVRKQVELGLDSETSSLAWQVIYITIVMLPCMVFPSTR